MKWRTKKKPNIGDTRKVTKFLWFPESIDKVDGTTEWHWLEFAKVEQVYEYRYSGGVWWWTVGIVDR